jgi:hypothetical protein
VRKVRKPRPKPRPVRPLVPSKVEALLGPRRHRRVDPRLLRAAPARATRAALARHRADDAASEPGQDRRDAPCGSWRRCAQTAPNGGSRQAWSPTWSSWSRASAPSWRGPSTGSRSGASACSRRNGGARARRARRCAGRAEPRLISARCSAAGRPLVGRTSRRPPPSGSCPAGQGACSPLARRGRRKTARNQPERGSPITGLARP